MLMNCRPGSMMTGTRTNRHNRPPVGMVRGQEESMNLNPVGSNQTEIERYGIIVLYSYQTPVAAFVPGLGGLCSSHKYSTTTSRHVNAAISRWGCSRTDVDQGVIDQLAG